MESKEIETKVIAFINENVHLENPTEIGLTTQFESLGLDSMDVIQLLFDAEDAFDIRFDEDNSKGFSTIGDIVTYIVQQKSL